MKKSLLLLASMLMSAVSFAQWTQPIPAFTEMADDGETVQYLYNVEAKGFLVGANDWNTRVSISATEGWKVKVSKEYEDPEAENLVPTGYYTMVDSVQNGSFAEQWRNIWASASNSIYTDYNNNDGASIQWTIKPVGNAYQLYCEAIINGSLGVAELFEGKPGNTRTWLFDNDLVYTYVDENDEEHADVPAIGGTFWDKWAFVSEEEYAAWVEKDSIYEAAMALGKTLENIPEGFDAAKWQGVFNNYNSTLAELQAANEELAEAILTFNSNQATVDNPGDMTGKIVNPNFDGIQFDGWQGSGFGAGGSTDECAERYDMTFDTYQIIEGLPNGVYKVLVNGFYRAGGPADDWNTKDDASQRLAKLYAVSGTDSLYNSLPSLASGATDQLSSGTQVGEGLYVPNSMVEFVTWENAGFYNNNAVMIAVENHTLKIGVRKDTKLGSDWTIVDTWRLMFYGDDIKAYKMMFDDAKNAINKDMQSIIVDGVSYDRTARQDYMDFLAKAESATSKEELKQYTREITGIAEKVLTSIPAYEELKAEYEKVIEELDNNTELGGLIEYFNDFVRYGTAEDQKTLYEEVVKFEGGDKIAVLDMAPLQVLKEGCFTTEGVKKYTEQFVELYKFCVANSLQPGQDCTNMLTNADFSKGFTGWTKPGAGNVGNFANLTPAIPNNVEVYENVVDIYQVVKGAQPGIYSISCKAFERPAANGSYDGSEPAKVFLYMNDFQTPVQNICKDAITDDEALDGENCYITRLYTSGAGSDLLDYQTEFGYVPNGMVGAAVAFKAGRYEQKVYGIVEDGQDMKIGLTSNGKTAHWVLWADFKITYEGITDEAVDALAESFVASATDYLDNNGESMTQPAIDDLTAAIGAAEDADDADAKYNAIIALNKAYNVDAPANVEALAEFLNAFDELTNALEEYGATASDDAITLASDLVDEADSYLDLTTAELKAFTQKIRDMIDALKIPAEEPSDDNPVDYTSLIVNADVDAGATVAWQYTKNGGNGPALANGIGGTPSIEFWNGTASNLQFDVNQTITLPAGTYELTADAANSLNGQASNGQTGRAYFYAIVQNDKQASASVPVEVVEGACTDEYSNYSIVFTLKEKSPVTIGFKSVGTMEARWFVCDNFVLTCYGTESSKKANSDEGEVNIAGINTVAGPAAIYSISGAKLNTLKKGINIVKGADGSVRKVFVK